MNFKKSFSKMKSLIDVLFIDRVKQCWCEVLHSYVHRYYFAEFCYLHFVCFLFSLPFVTFFDDPFLITLYLAL
jgi:hypothetical protein